MGTDILIMRRAVLGQANLALLFQIPSQARLHGIVKTQRPLAPRAPLLLLSSLDSGRSTPEDTWLPLTCQAGGCLEKHPKARLRVIFQNSSGIRATNQPWVFRGNKPVSLHP